MARLVRDSEAFGGSAEDDEDITFQETDYVEDGGTVKRNPGLVTRQVTHALVLHFLKKILGATSILFWGN